MSVAVAERSTLHIMDHTGHTTKEWDPAVASEVEAARAAFNQMKGRGYLAYSVNTKGDKGEVIKGFDPNAESIVMSPQMIGG